MKMPFVFFKHWSIFFLNSIKCMLQEEATFKMLKYTITGKKIKLMSSSFLIGGAIK